MNKRERLVYPAVIEANDDGYCVLFPGASMLTTCADTVEEAVDAAREVITLEYIDLEDQGQELEIPNVHSYELQNGQSIVYLDIWLPYEKAKVKTEYKKKTLTIPVWLDLLGTQKNINFSQILVNGLKLELGIK